MSEAASGFVEAVAHAQKEFKKPNVGHRIEGTTESMRCMLLSMNGTTHTQPQFSSDGESTNDDQEEEARRSSLQLLRCSIAAAIDHVQQMLASYWIH